MCGVHQVQDPETDDIAPDRAAWKLVYLRLADAFSFSFSFSWIAIGLWATRTGGAASFAAVTSVIYLAYPAAALTVGPLVRAAGVKGMLIASSLASGLFLSAAFVALSSSSRIWTLLSLIAVQSWAGSIASELVEHSAARRSPAGSLARIMAAYRIGMGSGGLAAGLLTAGSSDLAIVASGIAAATLSTAALLASARHVPEGALVPEGLSPMVHSMFGRRLAPLATMSLTVAPTLAVAPGLVAQADGTRTAGYLVAAMSAAAAFGPALVRMLRRNMRARPYASVSAAALLVSLHDVRSALLLIPAAALLYDAQVVEQEERLHSEHPGEPGVLAIPALLWSAGVGVGSVPVVRLAETCGMYAVSSVAVAALTAAWIFTARRRTDAQIL